MDQGVAGVIAGIAGLVGAGVGGLATAYGARIGAQKTLEAAQTQVERQATAEHAHWVREQRRQVYSAVVELEAAHTIAINGYQVQLERGDTPTTEQLHGLEDRYNRIAEVIACAHLWGPYELATKATLLRSAIAEEISSLVDWCLAIDEGRTGELHGCAQHYQAASDAVVTARRDFTGATQAVLANPAQTS
ncbi:MULTISPECIES: hypothetical protein [unclassified Streptomyces]|uniref:hypothetical protein n=1 Tax=unclassified Streptomyces TaxID=2593676 RepID=UPI000FE23FC5|nr:MULTISPECIES: hypothetical protein [unclassified Streptomyces]